MLSRAPGNRFGHQLLGFPRRATVLWWLHTSAEALFAVLDRLGVRVAPPRRSLAPSCVAVKAVLEPEAVEIHAPVGRIDRSPARFADAVSSAAVGYRTVGCEVVVLRAARFSVPSGLVLIDGFVPSETLLQRVWPHSYQQLPATRLRFARATPLPEGCFFAFPYWRSYYHWVVEMLPLAFALRGASKLPVYVPRHSPQFVHEYLDLLDLRERCVLLDSGTYTTAHLEVATIPGSGLNRPSPANVLMMRDILGRCVQGRSSRGRRLYVARSDAPDRRVRNEDAIVEMLDGYGFEPVAPAALTVSEQLSLFSEAEIVVGAHGAGLTNIVVAPAGCRVIELVGNKVVNPTYLVLTSLLGLPYVYVRGRDVYRDLVVSPDDVRSAVEAAISGGDAGDDAAAR